MNTADSNRICYRCLTYELADAAENGNGSLHTRLLALIERIPEQQRAGDAQYQSRLSLCRECDLLMDGMCRACGCYVELRAARNHQDCPHGRWEALATSAE
ncbi:DUF6171 family protein [Lachnoclostridium sp. Marseille-P6806]|uniref:DUF6171 family protein n=1 Tax=Lachnoclostridium sp. Marseille-P6806 TaxID=2364793 RepID=UPI001F5FBA6A|nr:DUF6171 family protein [Lachnoclostridium sp. Marseille-P6806]